MVIYRNGKWVSRRLILGRWIETPADLDDFILGGAVVLTAPAWLPLFMAAWVGGRVRGAIEDRRRGP